jgi:hypothetical protein
MKQLNMDGEVNLQGGDKGRKVLGREGESDMHYRQDLSSIPVPGFEALGTVLYICTVDNNNAICYYCYVVLRT